MTHLSDQPSYPPPPWQTHVEGAASSYLVPARALRLPAGFRPVSAFGRTSGMLAYLRYLPPSPLQYQELLWIPTMVRAAGKIGGYVEKIYVDDEASLAAGRTEWALPKTLARFERQGDRVVFAAEDGTHGTFRLRGFGPRQPLGTRLTTLQARADQVLQFVCTFSGRVQLGGLRVESFEPGGDRWPSFVGARSLGVGGRLSGGRATMHVAQRHERTAR